MIEAKLPDGTTLRFPDGTQDSVIDRVVQEHLSKNLQKDEVDTVAEYASDIGGAALAGTGRGVIGALSLPEMAARGVARAGQEALQYFGYDVGEDIPVLDTATERALKSGVEAVGLGEELEFRGETLPAKFAGTIGEFSAGGGALGLLGKGARVLGETTKLGRAGEQVARAGLSRAGQVATGVSAVGSEAAGQLAEGTAWEPAARIAGAFITPAGVATSINTTNKTLNALRGKNQARPTVEMLKAEKNIAYNAVKKSSEGFTVNETQDMVNRAIRSAFDQGAYELTDDATMAAVELLENLRGQQIGLKEFDKLQRKLSKIYKKSPDQPEVLTMIKSLDDSLAIKSGKGNLVKAAREANSKYAKAQLLEKEFAKHQRQAKVTGSGGNVVNKYRQSLQKILDNPNKVKFFSDGEIEAMTRIVNGTVSENTLRLAGKMAPSGNGLMTYLNLISATINPMFLGVTAVSGASKKISEAQIKRTTSKLQDLVAAGGVKGAESKKLINRDYVLELLSPFVGLAPQIPQEQ